ncbi:MAG: ABC transporter permease [Lawsonibacter sp.]
MKNLLQNKTLFITGVILVFFLLAAVFASVIAPYDPIAVDSQNRLLVWAANHIMGTDEFGRDIFSRLLTGLRPTLIIATSSMLLAMIFGTSFGVIAGVLGGIVETIIIRLTDVILCFPPMLLALMIVGFWGAGIYNLIFTLCITYMPTFIRLTYSSARKISKLEYIEAQKSLGAAWPRIIFKGVLPNISSQIIVQFSITFGSAILLESGLSFLGMGVVPPTPSLGVMIASAKGYLEQNLSMLIWPSVALVMLSLAVNIFGDALRDKLDPRLRRR